MTDDNPLKGKHVWTDAEVKQNYDDFMALRTELNIQMRMRDYNQELYADAIKEIADNERQITDLHEQVRVLQAFKDEVTPKKDDTVN